MIQLGDSSFWLEPGPEGWTLIEGRGKKRQRAAVRLGVFTSPAHVLQQHKVKLPEAARDFLHDMVDVSNAGTESLAELTLLQGAGEPGQTPPQAGQDARSTDGPEPDE
jgi:hypothetical protein